MFGCYRNALIKLSRRPGLARLIKNNQKPIYKGFSISQRTTAAMTETTIDPSSQSNYNSIRVVSSQYELDIDFHRHVIEGYVRLSAQVLQAADELVVDTRDLTIKSVELLTANESGASASGQKLGFSFGTPHPVSDRAPPYRRKRQRHVMTM